MKKNFIVRRSITIIEGKPHVETYSEQELIRCKDCKWWHESEMHNGYGDCGQANGIALKSSNWFCADGEHKEGL